MKFAKILRFGRRLKITKQKKRARNLVLTPKTEGLEGSHGGSLKKNALFIRAWSLHTSGKLLRAAANYRRLAKQRSMCFAATYNLGLLNLELGRTQRAAKILQAAVKLKPDMAHSWAGLGVALEVGGEICSAIHAYQYALARDQHLHPAYQGLVTSLRQAVFKHGDCANLVEPSGRLAVSVQGQQSRISVVICSIDADKERRVRENYERVLAGTDYEITVIRDAKSLCEGYNRGIARSTGDVLIFSHDDIEILCDDFSDRLLSHLAHYDIIGVAGTSRLTQPCWAAAGWPHVHGQVIHKHPDENEYQVHVFGVDPVVLGSAQALDGVLMAVNRPVLEKVGFDERRFNGFHFYDVDFSFSAFLAGLRVAVCSDIVLIHYSKGRTFEQSWQTYANIFQEKHRQRLGPEEPDVVPQDVIIPRFRTVESARRFCLQNLRSSRVIAAERATMTGDSESRSSDRILSARTCCET